MPMVRGYRHILIAVVLWEGGYGGEEGWGGGGGGRGGGEEVRWVEVWSRGGGGGGVPGCFIWGVWGVKPCGCRGNNNCGGGGI